MTLGETAWVDRNLRTAWDRIAAEVPEDWMPLVVTEEDARMRSGGRRKFSVEELGCGHYGCVMPTLEEGLVCKLTSDITEARFVSAYLSLPKRDVAEGGIVKYEKLLALAGQEHRRRPLFVLWREEAHDLGFMFQANRGWAASDLGIPEYQLRAMREGTKLLDLFLRWARDARDKIDRLHKKNGVLAQRPELRQPILEAVWRAYEDASPEADPRHYRGIPRIGVALRKCWGISMEMANTDVIYPVGAALNDYMDEGLLLADVHLNNIGKNLQDLTVITDPGHVVAINPRWASWPEVPVV